MLSLPDHFIPGFAWPDPPGDHPHWFIFAANKLLVLDTADGPTVPTGRDRPLSQADPLRQLFMGHWGDNPCFAAEFAADIEPPSGGRWLGLRETWGLLEPALIGLAGQGLQLVDWDRCHQYCGRCAGATVRRDNERARHCPTCGLNQYPRVAPAVMMRVTRGDEILLARSPRFVPGMYSVLAGFVDPGETLEQAVHREIMEEVGLQVRGLRYLCSQSWPFPHSLMVAFSAEYAAGELTPAPGEIEDAGWFRRDSLPKIPPTMSIARRLIDGYLRGDDGLP